jgi:hypothetical protein
MELAEKLSEILKNLEGKKLFPMAFHVDELVATKSSEPGYHDGWDEYEYQIGTDVLKLVADEEDGAFCLDIKLNGKTEYSTGYIGAVSWDEDDNEIEFDYEAYSDYDADAEALFELIMQHGGVIDEEGAQARAAYFAMYYEKPIEN